MFWTRPAKRPQRSSRQPRFEDLEARRLLTASPTSPFIGLPTTLDPADKILGASLTRNRYQVDGTGMTAAVIDTGVNYWHPALGGTFGPGSKVKAGYDFADNDGDPMPTAQHGTSVAGLIASEDLTHPGVAPEADIVGLKVFGANGQSDFGDVTRALQWVVDNGPSQGVSVVNISIADGGSYKTNFFPLNGGAGAQITALIQKLATMKVPVVIAAGNSFDGNPGMGFPAIVADSLSVTGTDVNDKLLPDAQRLASGPSATDFAVPGSGLIAPTVGSDFAPATGTSFAAAEMTGSVLLLQEIYKARFGTLPAVSDLSTWLKNGSVKINDPATGATFNRVDLAAAAAQVPTPPAPQTDTLINTPTPVPTPVPVVPPAASPQVVVPMVENMTLNGQSVAPLPKDKVTALFGTLIAQMGGTSGRVNVQVFGPAPAPSTPAAKPVSSPWGMLRVWNASASNKTTKPITAASTPGRPKPASSALTFWKKTFGHLRT